MTVNRRERSAGQPRLVDRRRRRGIPLAEHGPRAAARQPRRDSPALLADRAHRLAVHGLRHVGRPGRRAARQHPLGARLRRTPVVRQRRRPHRGRSAAPRPRSTPPANSPVRDRGGRGQRAAADAGRRARRCLPARDGCRSATPASRSPRRTRSTSATGSTASTPTGSTPARAARRSTRTSRRAATGSASKPTPTTAPGSRRPPPGTSRSSRRSTRPPGSTPRRSASSR